MNAHTPLPPARNGAAPKMPAHVTHYEAPLPLSADDYYAKQLARYARLEVKAARAMGWYANTIQSMATGKAAGILAANNTVPRRRAKRVIGVLRQVEAGVTNSLDIRRAVGLEKNTGTFSDLVSSGELIRTAPATYALTEKGRNTLAMEARNG